MIDIPERICCCETCGIKLDENFGTYVTGVRAGAAWRCAVCLPIEGPSGRLLRDKVVQERRKKLSVAVRR